MMDLYNVNVQIPCHVVYGGEKWSRLIFPFDSNAAAQCDLWRWN